MDIKETSAGKKFLQAKKTYREAFQRYQGKHLESLRKEIMRITGADIKSESMAPLVDWNHPDFSLKRLRESVATACGKLREANDASTLQQFLRAGIQTAVNSMYEQIAVNYDEWVMGVKSNMLIELYAPKYRAGFIAPIEELEEPPETGIRAMDIEIRNKEKALIIVISRNLIDFDQTGQAVQEANQVGENAHNVKDSYCYQKWLSPSGGGTDAGGYYVPTSQTGAQAGETTWPWNTAFTNGGGQNRPSSYMSLSYQAIVYGRYLGRKMLDPKGQKMLVNHDTILSGVGVSDAIHEMIDPDSQFWPSSTTIKQVGKYSGGGTASSDTGAGVQHAKNLLKGKFNICDTVWLSDTCYGLTQAHKGFVLQQARPLAVVQENPVSGSSFSVRAFRYRVDEMYEADFIEPRFSVLLSDGSV